jgi:hypothetical protein
LPDWSCAAVDADAVRVTAGFRSLDRTKIMTVAPNHTNDSATEFPSESLAKTPPGSLLAHRLTEHLINRRVRNTPTAPTAGEAC